MTRGRNAAFPSQNGTAAIPVSNAGGFENMPPANRNKANLAKPGSKSGGRRVIFGAKSVGIGACVLAAVSLMTMVPWLLPDLTDLPEYRFSLAETEVNSPHAWVPATVLTEVLKKAHLPDQVSLLDQDLCRNVAAAFATHPWVEKVESVRITPVPSLRVELVYRIPVAFVELPQGLYAVDRNGVVLPTADFPIERTDRLPHLRGIVTQPRGGIGGAWGDPIVAAGAQLASVLAPGGDLARYWERFELKAIVASAGNPTNPETLVPTFELETSGGSRILWGKPPGADELEPSVEQKLARLEQYLLRFGSFDAPNGPYRIDIRLFDAISLQPLKTIR